MKDVKDDAVAAMRNGATREQVFDAARARANGTCKRVEASLAMVNIPLGDRPAPRPLRSFERRPAFPTGLFPSWLEEYILEITRALEVPLDLAGLCAFGVLAPVFQKRFAVQINSDYTESLSIHAVVGLEPGGRKSSVFKLLFDPIHEFEGSEYERLQPMIMEMHRKRGLIEKSIAALQRKLGNKKSLSNEGDLDSAYKDLDALEIPIAPLLTLDDATPEAVADNLAAQGGRIAIASAEGAFLDILRGRYNDKPAIEVCLKGHSGEMLKIHRKDKTKPPIIIKSPALSMILSIQPNVISTFGNVESLAGRGLLSRIIFILPNSTLGFRNHDQAPVKNTVKTEYRARILTLLKPPENRNELTKEIDPKFIVCTAEVQAAVKALSREIEPEMQPGGGLRDMSGYLSGFGGKAAGRAVRVAGLLALANEGEEVNLNHFQNGKRFVDYAIGHARIVAGFVSEDPAITNAKRVLEWIKRRIMLCDLEAYVAQQQERERRRVGK